MKIIRNPKIMHRWFPVTIIILWILVQNFIDVGSNIARDVIYIAQNPRASYDQKMERKIGKQFYNYAQFIKANTPENAKILIPPFPTSPWPQSGNIPYMTYFLHPRILLNGEEYSSSYNLKDEDVDYVLVAWGEMTPTVGEHTNGWPKFDVKAEEIIYMTDSGKEIIKGEDYIYDEVKNSQKWGIIKVKK